MKNFFLMFFALLVAVSLTSFGQVPPKISYQGLLTTGAGSPVADGSYDLKFEIFNLPSGGTLRHTETHAGVPVQRGTFSLALGPLPAIFSESLYVEVTALAGPGIGSPLTFSPRSELTSAPYSLQSVSLLGPNSIATGVAANAGGSYNQASGDYSTVAGGAVDSASGLYSTVGGGTYNTASGASSTVDGGAYNRASGNISAVGGGYFNSASSSSSTVGGGYINSASGPFSTVGGGYTNTASSISATVGGGYFNTASRYYATVGGGYRNTANSDGSTVGGGEYNIASSYEATVGGGLYNVANGLYAAVPGGQYDSAAGNGSFAAGRYAKARHDGAFVWSDGADFGSTGTNQFLIHADGGVGIGTNTPNPSGDVSYSPVMTLGPTGTNKTAVLELQCNAVSATGVGALIFRNTAIGSPENRLAQIHVGNGPSFDDGILVFSTRPASGTISERMRLTPSGNLGIGTTAPAYKLEVNGDINAIGSVRSNGTALTSDVRFKKNISTISHALDDLKSLRGVSYYWKKEEFPQKQFNEEKQIGFIAQELERVFPELVSTGADGYKGVDYARLTPVLVEAIKELDAKIAECERLQKENHDLSSRLTRLEAIVKSLVTEKQSESNKSIGELK